MPIDFYGALSPAQGDARAAICANAARQYDALAAGGTDSPNDFFIDLATLARTAPDAESPLLGPPLTNRAAFLLVVGQTYALGIPYAPFYHLLAPVLDGDAAVGLREVSDAAALAWFEGATRHQSMREAADLDAVLCGEAPPVDAPLARIRVPLYYLGAAGGVGARSVLDDPDRLARCHDAGRPAVRCRRGRGLRPRRPAAGRRCAGAGLARARGLAGRTLTQRK